MPTYDYRCTACGHEFELVQPMSAPVRRKCPACKTLKLKRLIGIGAGFIVKGRTSAAPAESKPASTEETSTDTTADATPKADTADSSDSSSQDLPVEKKVSGSTSTPTHAAREHRGVGNLVDKAKRLAVEKRSSKATSQKKGLNKKSDVGKPSSNKPAPNKSTTSKSSARKHPKKSPSGKKASRTRRSRN